MSLADRVRDLLGPDGPLAGRLAGYEERREQVALCTAVAESLSAGEPIVAEAGTGVGKTFAYLVPALLWSHETGQPVLVSTRTKTLQEQLARKDLPFLESVLPVPFTWAVAVGRANYVCLRRLDRARQATRELFADPEDRNELDHIAAWAAQGPARGVRDELPFVPSGRVWEEVQAEPGNCLGPECRWYAPCPWQRGKRAMRSARLVVVNHALYFADLALRRQGVPYLPDHECVVFDEAHHLEDIASDHLGLRFTPAQLEWHLSRLRSRDGKRGLLPRLGLSTEAAAIDEARELGVLYWEQPSALLAARGGEPLRLAADVTVEDELSRGLESLAHALADAHHALEREAAMELAAHAQRLQGLAAAARAFATPVPENEVRWLELERRQPVLRAAPIRVADTLREELFARRPRAILVSATLGPPAGGFGWLRSRLGLDTARTLQVGSPFPYEENVELVLEEALPDPGAQPSEFEREASLRIRDLCLENRGRALVLCTSWRFLTRCRELLEEPLAAAGLPLLVQGDRPLSLLIEEKRQQPESVLVGTDSLWEGIDIAGDAVTLLVLTRFPFPVPSHPLVAARCADIERRGGQSFRDYSLPLAVLRFKQGFGRLVRTAQDRGRVVVLDPRARRRPYGREFLAALPTCRR